MTSNLINNAAPFEIADYRVEPSTLRVSCYGREARLEPKAMEVLVYLAQSAGRVVSRDELEQNIWPDTYVTEDAVTNAVAKVRRAFGDNARNPRFVETVPKVGYRIIAPLTLIGKANREGETNSTSAQNDPRSEEENVSHQVTSVRTFHIGFNPKNAPALVREKIVGHWQRAAIVSLFLLIAAAGAAMLWRAYVDPFVSKSEVARQAVNAPTLPAKPSIAVLPFKNISGEAKHDYFSDGITEDIITDISKFGDLFVIASSTVFTFKGRPVTVQNVSRELGVQYVLEGSVQRIGDQVRVNSQLIDGTTGGHVWAERFVRDTNELFALQDEIVGSIVAKLASNIDKVERDRAMRKGTEDIKAYDYVLRGREYRGRSARSANAQAREMFRRAIALDSRYATAYADLGWCYIDAFLWGWTDRPSYALEQAQILAQTALRIDEHNVTAHRLLGITYLKWKQYELAIKEFQRALELNPNDAFSYEALGGALLYSGKHDDAIDAIETAKRFNPNLQPSSRIDLALAYYLREQYGEAIKTLELMLGRKSNLASVYVALAAAYVQAGRGGDALRAVAKVRELNPFFEVDTFGSAFRSPDDRASIRAGLRKAGLK